MFKLVLLLVFLLSEKHLRFSNKKGFNKKQVVIKKCRCIIMEAYIISVDFHVFLQNIINFHLWVYVVLVCWILYSSNSISRWEWTQVKIFQKSFFFAVSTLKFVTFINFCPLKVLYNSFDRKKIITFDNSSKNFSDLLTVVEGYVFFQFNINYIPSSSCCQCLHSAHKRLYILWNIV